MSHGKNSIETAKELIDNADRICVLTGAGISTDSGIPDFRGPEGLWTKNPEAEKLSTIQNYIKDPEMRKASWDLFVTGWGDYQPNTGHYCLAALSHLKSTAVITQNIDGLHWATDHKFTNMIDIHGNLNEFKCIDCGNIWQKNDSVIYNGDVLRHTNIDLASKCDGLLKPNIIYFGELLDPSLWTDAIGLTTSCDVFLAIGTSLQVWPAADLVKVAFDWHKKIIIINGNPTDYDDYATVVLNGSISHILRDIMYGKN